MNQNAAVQLSESAGFLIVGIDDLAKIINRASATVRTQATREPHKLPPRFVDGTSAAGWLLKDVWEWMSSKRAAPDPELSDRVSIGPQPLTHSLPKARRGAPTAAEKTAAIAAGMTVSQYRSALAKGGKQ